ncbi:hypothetical protein [Nitrospira sp. Nam74]
MRINALLVVFAILLMPALSDARCRTVGESASVATEYGTFPLYPAVRLVEAGHERDSIPLQLIGYGLSVPLFVIAAPFAMLGAGVGTVLHPWSKCIDTDQHLSGGSIVPVEPERSDRFSRQNSNDGEK